MKLSEKILDLRKKAGMSQEELAEKLDVSRQAVSRWEVGSAQPDASNVLQLSRLFGVTADYLLNDDYVSDSDIPAVKRTEARGRSRVWCVAAGCVSALGLFGNFIIYLLSRFIEVLMPRIIEEGGKQVYAWGNGYRGHSYKYFIIQYDLEALAVCCWLLVAAGIIFILLNTKKGRALVAWVRERVLRIVRGRRERKAEK